MTVGQEQAKSCVEFAGGAGDALESILLSVHKIADMSAVIASASTQQSAAASELSDNLDAIKSASHEAHDTASRSYSASQGLAKTAREVVQSVTV